LTERVREIKFEHFRGLPEYSCKMKGKSLVVLGGNGKGKSGIVDGLEFLFSGRIARFHGEGTGAIDAEAAIQHIHKKGEAAIELWFTPTNDKIKRALSSEELEMPSRVTIQDYVEHHPPAESFILRRAQILNFISDQDANRYRKYIQLLGLTEIDRVQRAFVDASQQADDKLARSRQDLASELGVFREAGRSASTVDAILTQCSEAAGPLGGPPLNTWDDLDPVISFLESRRSSETRAQVDALNKAISSLERQMPVGISQLAATANETQTILATLTAASEEAAAGGIIKAGISFFHDHEEATVCPLCEKPLDENYSDVMQRLRGRDEALSQLRDSENLLANTLNQLATRCQQAADRLGRDLENSDLLAPDEIKSLDDSRSSLSHCVEASNAARRDPTAAKIIVPEGMEALTALRERLVVDLSARRAQLIPADSAQLENAIVLLRNAQTSVPKIRNCEAAVRRCEQEGKATTHSREAFSTAREKAIQQVFDQIASKVLQYYKKLHELPDNSDKAECTSISLKATPRAAAGGLRLAIDFLGEADSSDARAFLSEGHLDSLGLCIYLATVRMFNHPGTLLVLDDVLTSIDRDHRHRVAELLFEEFADYQIILTTHDEHWFGILQSMAQARGDQGNWGFNRIANWTLDRGPESAAFENTWSYIDENLNEDSYRELGGSLRLVLEDFLKRVAEKIDLKVKYKLDGRYTSGDFTHAGIQDVIRKQLIEQSPSEESDIKRDVGRVFGNGDLINFLSHDNPGRLEVTLSQTIDFVCGLKSLMDRCQRQKLMKGLGG
jgi:hypothetical protein